MDRGYESYAPSHPGYDKLPVQAATEWLRVSEGSPATTLEVKLKSAPPADDYALVLSIGVCFGTPAPGGSVELVEHAGCGKIVAVSGISDQFLNFKKTSRLYAAEQALVEENKND